MNGKLKNSTLCLGVLLAAAFIFTGFQSADSNSLSNMEQLGKDLFFDENLSSQKNQSCATCHAPQTGFTGPDSTINRVLGVYPGSHDDKFGNRKPPTAAYAGFSPIMFEESTGFFVGGMFWDGRATGERLLDPIAEQAQGPFLNPVEQALLSIQEVCEVVENSAYVGSYNFEFPPALDCDEVLLDDFYDNIATAIAAYERSSEVNPFSSKFDDFYTAMSGNVSTFGTNTNGDYDFNPDGWTGPVYNKTEAWGLALFNAADKGNCAACHLTEDDPEALQPLFTDFTYDNLGIPRNHKNPWYKMTEFNPDGKDWIDNGLGGFLAIRDDGWEEHEDENLGKHKVPTLRNVDKRPYSKFVKSYGHNGFFKSLEEITHFYNTRDVEKWPEPEVSANVNSDELGDLELTPDEEAAIVAFMKTLSDGYILP